MKTKIKEDVRGQGKNWRRQEARSEAELQRLLYTMGR